MRDALLFRIALLLLCVQPAVHCAAQGGQPGKSVAVGKGSYASAPPSNAPDAMRQVNEKALYVLDKGDRPIPTNQWWTNLIIDRYAGQIWAFPQMVTADKQGVKHITD